MKSKRERCILDDDVGLLNGTSLQTKERPIMVFNELIFYTRGQCPIETGGECDLILSDLCLAFD